MSDLTALDYQRAISIVSGTQDWKELCVEVAKTNPDVLVKAHNRVSSHWEGR